MIRVAITIEPKGDPRAARRLATLTIENVGADDRGTDYVVRLFDGERVRAGARVEGFDRARGAMALVLEALGAIEGKVGHARC